MPYNILSIWGDIVKKKHETQLLVGSWKLD